MSPKETWMNKQEQAWNDTQNSFKRTLSRYPELMEFVVRNYDVIRDMTSHSEVPFNKHFIYDIPVFDVLEAMKWVSFFVSHELWDDGSPGIVYLKKDLGNLQELEPKERVRRVFSAPWTLSQDETDHPVLVQECYEIPGSRYLCPSSSHPVPEELKIAVNKVLEHRKKVQEAHKAFRLQEIPQYNASEVQEALVELLLG